ncbi:MAG: DNA polymerase III subunit delta' [Acidobacteria bacterium]|nr:DNA polymerase III subunit delta' [Acidobacteriota bacterium]
MKFSSLIGNEPIKRRLQRSVADGRIGQSLIFAGQRGIGKHQFALALAQAVNCLQPLEGDACGVCTNCKKFAAREFTDVKTIEPIGQFIKVEQMREMSEEANFMPYEGRRRVYILDEAERLNLAAANSILKILEEPPDTSLLLLITAKPYALLETIRSRCQMLNFAPLATSALEAYLQANYKRPLAETTLLARLARGSIGRALEIDLGEYKEKRGAMMELLEALTVSRDSIRLMSFAEMLGRKLDKAGFENHVDLLLLLLEDLFHLKLGKSIDALTNADILPRLEAVAEVTSLEKIMEWVEKLEAVLQNLARNINRHIAMEALLITA